MTTYQILSLLGFPTVLFTLYGYFWKSLKKLKLTNDAVRLGVQALLRSEMIREWNKYSELGYAPIYARENFENCWKQYHSLGVDGVMDDVYKKFMSLPIKRKDD